MLNLTLVQKLCLIINTCLLFQKCIIRGPKILTYNLSYIHQNKNQIQQRSHSNWGLSSPGVLNLSLAMCPFSIPTDKYVPLQHFTRSACSPSSFWQVYMYPYNLLWQIILSWSFTDLFNNKHILIFENNIRWYMYKYLERNNMSIYFYVPLQIGKCTPGGTCSPGWELLV